MTALIRYDAARKAIASAYRVDEAKKSATKRKQSEPTPNWRAICNFKTKHAKSGYAPSAGQVNS